ncbi:aspartate/glutamate racemase family protein [Aurantiacibacter sp. D1-12]|uniref:aspartate/glutamate racemase family protein n=1 Tax=Aurantiacibacter sp. D1-12 TaxID=2993658 RepID=UPI00237D264C|nr:amino acid racemase [Aurantiacibacter sp. D1-12]MDE1466328.1 amino acid racemase [Aurantiacibacter sp. D1-12]
MRKLGMIGGMSWVSTHRYYERINRQIQREVDPKASAPLLIESLNFAEIYCLESDEDWERAVGVLSDAANRLADAGAQQLIICANSMHKVYREVQARVEVPMLHIAECVGERMKADGIEQAALIGSRNVMTESFYRRRLIAHGVRLLPPEMSDVDDLNRIIYDELMVGKARKDSERVLKSMLTRYESNGAKGIVLANTELELIVDVNANVLPIYDCMRIHADAAAKWIIGG